MIQLRIFSSDQCLYAEFPATVTGHTYTIIIISSIGDSHLAYGYMYMCSLTAETSFPVPAHAQLCLGARLIFHSPYYYYYVPVCGW